MISREGPDPSAEKAALERFRTALVNAAGIAPCLPLGEQYVEDLRAADVERERELDARRRG